MFGEANRSTLRANIKKNIVLAIRNTTLGNTSDTLGDVSVLPSAGSQAQSVKVDQ
jgi:hypothetical protein